MPAGTRKAILITANRRRIMKILIVDDEFVSRQKAQKILSSYGYCDSAASGAEALQALDMARDEGRPYDLVTMDVIMPEMDGIETLRRIREREKKLGLDFHNGVKVIMLTAKESVESVRTSFWEGCEAYVTKPFNRDKLELALKQFVFESADP